MNELTKEQQDIIDHAGKDYARSYKRKEIGYYSLNFAAGAKWALSSSDLLRGVLEEFTRWRDSLIASDKHWYWNSGMKLEYSLTELVTKFLTDKQKEDESASVGKI